ncbi:MAG: cyclic nucleotide-binding domain-containing protein [Deltaproteobacteria bacterium]|nr:cyclic nucleotide-binding domain-containing protein [Deltaproteobacteria bacterium]MBW2020418.1 cyclic nucleotide-binding domain-containing protein [Deltaproteobacteria bacterium]MBW2075162.1 cyclic nucleotide-binding domain-containing protein [Deltaproteobacteria bacterium]
MTIARILHNANLFKALSDDQLKAVIQLGQVKRFEPDEEIFKQGEQAKTIYVLLDGLVRLRIKAPEELDLMAETLQEPGSVFGMAALSKSHVYNVTAKCIKSTTALAIDSGGLKEIITRDPFVGVEVMAELAQLYSNRLNNTRAAATNLFRIFKAQTHKANIYDVYGEPEYKH